MGSKQLESKFLQRIQLCSHTPSALNAGAQRSGATCHLAMPQCCYLAKGAKRPSHTTNTIKFNRIPFDPCNSIKRFDLCPFDQKNSTYSQPPFLRVVWVLHPQLCGYFTRKIRPIYSHPFCGLSEYFTFGVHEQQVFLLLEIVFRKNAYVLGKEFIVNGFFSCHF